MPTENYFGLSNGPPLKLDLAVNKKVSSCQTRRLKIGDLRNSGKIVIWVLIFNSIIFKKNEYGYTLLQKIIFFCVTFRLFLFVCGHGATFLFLITGCNGSGK